MCLDAPWVDPTEQLICPTNSGIHKLAMPSRRLFGLERSYIEDILNRKTYSPETNWLQRLQKPLHNTTAGGR